MASLALFLNSLAGNGHTSSPSTTTWPSATRNGTGASSTARSDRRRDPELHALPGARLTRAGPTSRDQLRVRLRLPARQHGRLAGRGRPARPCVRDRGRGRLDPDRRGPDAVDHLGRGETAARRITTSRESSAISTDSRRPARRRRGSTRRSSPAPTTSTTRRTRPVSPAQIAIEKIERALGIDNLYDPRHVQLVNHLSQALKAESLYKRDVDYVIQDGEVKIVDEFTGRIMEGAAGARACTRRSRRKRACASARKTSRSRRSRCRTTSGSTRSLPA